MSNGVMIENERIDEELIQSELEEFFEEENQIQNNIAEEVFNLPFRVENILISDYCQLNDINSMNIIDVEVNPPPMPNQCLLGIKDIISGTTYSHLFLASNELVIPHIRGVVPLIKIRTSGNKLIGSGFEIFEMFHDSGNYYTLFCYVPFISGKKIFGFGISHTSSYNSQRFFSVGFCKEDDIIPTFEMPPDNFRDGRLPLEESDKIICSNTSARFRKLSEVWGNIYDATSELNEMLRNTIDPNYMEKIMRMNMFFTVPNAQING